MRADNRSALPIDKQERARRCHSDKLAVWRPGDSRGKVSRCWEMHLNKMFAGGRIPDLHTIHRRGGDPFAIGGEGQPVEAYWIAWCSIECMPKGCCWRWCRSRTGHRCRNSNNCCCLYLSPTRRHGGLLVQIAL